MKISVIIPTYNSSEFIIKAVSSVIHQSKKPYEIIISDDGSTDNTIQLLQEYINKNRVNIRINIIKNNHKGPGAARNMGIEDSTGDWIAFLDSDDYWLRDKLEKVEKKVIYTPNINFICHNEIWISENNLKKK